MLTVNSITNDLYTVLFLSSADHMFDVLMLNSLHMQLMLSMFPMLNQKCYTAIKTY